MLHAVMFLGALCIVETVQSADKVARNTTNALKLHALAHKMCFIRYADTFHFSTP